MQIFLVLALALLILFVSLLYTRVGRNEKVANLQRTLRVPLHAVAQILFALIFVTCSQNPVSVPCSILWAEYCAIEGLVAYLVWPACYPALSAMPLNVSVPLQLIVYSIFMSHNAKMCGNGFAACNGAPRQYKMLQEVMKRLASAFPIGFSTAPPMENSKYGDCNRILTLIETVLLLVVSFYISFAVEISSRLAYCVATRNGELFVEVWRRKFSYGNL